MLFAEYPYLIYSKIIPISQLCYKKITHILVFVLMRCCLLMYQHQYSSAEQSRLLWPIDAGTLTNNSALKQTPGYE